jgi:hypothetical protein
VFAAADPRVSYSYTRDSYDPTKIVSTKATCNVRGCGWVEASTSKQRVQKKARQHRAEHRKALNGGEQGTIFDALGAAS